MAGLCKMENTCEGWRVKGETSCVSLGRVRKRTSGRAATRRGKERERERERERKKGGCDGREKENGTTRTWRAEQKHRARRERESWRDAEEKGLMRMKQGSGCMRRCIDDAREHSPGRCTLKVH